MRALAIISVFLPRLAERLAERLAVEAAAGPSARAPARPRRSSACSGGCGPGRGGPGRSRSRGPRRAACSRTGTRTSVKRRCMWPCGASSSPNTCIGAEDLDAGRVHRHEDLRLPLVRRRVRVGLHHDDHDLAARVAGAGDVVLLAVDHPLVAVAHRPGRRCSWRPTRRRRARSSRRPSGSRRRAAAPATASSAPACRPARAPPCCRCRGPLQLRHSEASGFLPSSIGDVRVVEVRQALAGLGVGQEEVPQPVGLGLGLHRLEQLELARRRSPSARPGPRRAGSTPR